MMERFRVVFDALPVARWGPLFHVLCCGQPDVRLEWRSAGFPVRERPLLGDADVGLFVEPAADPGLSTLTIERSPMVVLVAVSHRLSAYDELRVVDILDQPFVGCAGVQPAWTAFWTLDEYRGAPPEWTDDDVWDFQQTLPVIASGRAIGTSCASLASGLPHPGVMAVRLQDGPLVTTRLVWESGTRNATVKRLLELAEDLTRVATLA
jgi:DNA-binding transcriptional LysR family regulator